MDYYFPFTELRKFQKEFMDGVYDTLLEKKNLLVHAPTGVGKCVAGDTLVLTQKGLIKIKNLFGQSMKVNSLNKNLKVVVQDGYVVKKKRSKLYRLKTRTGRIIEATKDHKFMTIRGGLPVWITLGSINKGDYIASARKINLIEKEFKLTLGDVDNLDDVWKKKLKLIISPGISDLLKQIKDETGMGTRSLADYFKFNRKLFVKAFRGEMIPFDLIEKIVVYLKIKKEDVEIDEVGFCNSSFSIKTVMDKDFAYLFGLLIGDGHLSSTDLKLILSNEDEEIVSFFKQIMLRYGSNVFKKSGKRKNCDWCSVNKSFGLFLLLLGFKSGRKSHKIEIPSFFFQNKVILAELIKGIYDADGTSSGGNLELTTKSKYLMQTLLVGLLAFGIYPIVKEKVLDEVVYYRIFMFNSVEKKKFFDNIGFRLSRKQLELSKGIKNANHNLDVIPHSAELIKKVRLELGIPYSRARDFRIYESYVYGLRNPSRERLRNIFEKFVSMSSPSLDSLKMLWESDIFWDEVVEINYVKEDFVYDATVPNTSNFIGNGLILHNTSAVLAPVLKFAVEQKKVVFFLTTRNTQHMIAVETLKAIKDKFGLSAVVDLIGKKKMCSQSGIDMLTSGEFAQYCKHLKEKNECEFYMDIKKNGKLSVGVQSTLDKLKIASPQMVMDFKEACQGYCPHEMAMLMSKDAVAVVADYNYVLNPMIRKNFLLRMGKKMEDCIFIFDEAHNLPARSRDEMSVSLSSRVLVWAAKECKDYGHQDVETQLMNFYHRLERLSQERITEKNEVLLKKSDLIFEGYEQMVGSLNFIAEEVLEKKRKSFCSSIAHFFETWTGRDDGFVRILKKDRDKIGKWFLKVEYNCLSPSYLMDTVVEESYAVVGMSGTMNPLGMYIDLLGLKDCKLLEFKSPFPSENRMNIVVPRTSTRYKLRGEAMYKEISSVIADVANNVDGNVAVFFPSYYLRDEIYKFFMVQSEKTILLEESSLKSKELFDKFASYKETGAVLLGVLGGSFSEGIDFCGDLLKGVVVVGLPLAPPDLQTRELITYYDRMYSKGWDYGYTIPALIKSVQSAGRCIRSSTDKGVIVFLDERYTWRGYYDSFPKDWKIVIDREPGTRVKKFFENIIK